MSKSVRALAALALGIALAPLPAQADNATYNPASHGLAGTPAFASSYALEIKSPSSLNPSGTTQINNGGITVAVKVTATSWPAGSSQEIAEGLVTLDVSSLTFTALSQSRTVNVTFTATGATLPGDYSYSIQGDPPTGLGWGVGAHTLGVEVAEPTSVDETPPNVTITSPADGSSFVFCPAGNTVPVTVIATDAESEVTSVIADVNGTTVALTYTPSNNVTATGTFTASGVGVYNVNASADSAGGTGYASQVSVTVQYNATWLPPLALGKTSKGGSTIPIKITARDCHGDFVRDETVTIRVYEGSALKFEATFGEGADSVRIDDVDAHYITNFQTESGPHTYTAKVYFNGLVHASVNFSVR